MSWIDESRHAQSRIVERYLLVCIAACLAAFSTAWPFGFLFDLGAPVWWGQIISMALLVLLLQQCVSAREAGGIGLLFAATWQTATYWWLFISMHTYAGLPALQAALAVVALSVVLSLYYAFACTIYWRTQLQAGYSAPLCFAALWLMAEMARGTWLTGFGWGSAGYAHVEGPLSVFAPIVGVYGLGAIAAWVASVLVRGGHSSRAAALAVLLLGGFLHYVLPSWTEPAGSLTVDLLQGNIAQDEKFQSGSGVPQALEWYRTKIQTAQSELIVAPETAIPILPVELPTGYWDGLQDRFAHGGQGLLLGIPLGSYRKGYTNSVVGLSPSHESAWQYDKHHLVPFGEFIPPFFKWFVRMMDIPLGDFNRGALGQASFEWKSQRLALNICYEDLFGEELAVRFLDATKSPTVLVNVSNIGWFGNSVAIDQHLQISRMRAMELARPMLRATNTGPTVIIDHTGRVTHQLPRHVAGVLSGEVQGRTGTTPYAWWVARMGLWPLWAIALAIVLIAARAQAVRGKR
jgi:apolipoprotein N-acyltransferase